MAVICDTMTEFDKWLNETLSETSIDSEVYGPYIKSILESDDADEDKKEGVQELLDEILVGKIVDTYTLIVI